MVVEAESSISGKVDVRERAQALLSPIYVNEFLKDEMMGGKISK